MPASRPSIPKCTKGTAQADTIDKIRKTKCRQCGRALRLANPETAMQNHPKTEPKPKAPSKATLSSLTFDRRIWFGGNYLKIDFL